MLVVSFLTLCSERVDLSQLPVALASLAGVALQSFQELMIVMVLVLLSVLVYIKRSHVYETLGIDDRNIIHYMNVQGHGGEFLAFQVCVWRVCGDQGDADRYEQIGSRQGFERRLRLLPGQGRRCSMFVRLACGDNEPQTSRVNRMQDVLRPHTYVVFKESFSLEFADEPDTNVKMHIEIREQHTIGVTELTRVTFDIEDLKDAITESTNKAMRASEHPGSVNKDLSIVKPAKRPSTRALGMEGQQPERLRPLQPWEQQVAQMVAGEKAFRDSEQSEGSVWDCMTCSGTEDPEVDETTQRMLLYGFKPYRLNNGGAVWLAFSWLPPSS
jgi:hypothetical protein